MKFNKHFIDNTNKSKTNDNHYRSYLFIRGGKNYG